MDALPARAWFVIACFFALGWATCETRRVLDKRRRQRNSDPQRIGNNLQLSYAIRGIVLASILTAVTMARFDWPVLVAWLVSINVATLVFYGWDKVAAVISVLRVPETSLHALALVGGSPGVLIGQDLFKHKISARKAGFRGVLLGIVGLQAAGLVLYLRSRTGS